GRHHLIFGPERSSAKRLAAPLSLVNSTPSRSNSAPGAGADGMTMSGPNQRGCAAIVGPSQESAHSTRRAEGLTAITAPLLVITKTIPSCASNCARGAVVPPRQFEPTAA